jgi:hypothetical protein
MEESVITIKMASFKKFVCSRMASIIQMGHFKKNILESLKVKI